MKNHRGYQVILLFCFSCFLILNQSFGQSNIDIKELISKADLDYQKPVIRSEEGMPVGNGRMGSLVWTTPAELKFQINRVDIFGNNGASNNFFERNTDYCSGAALIDLDFYKWNEDVFSGDSFRQHLSCFNGVVTTEGNKIFTEVFVSNDYNVLAVRINDRREMPQAITINLRMLRDTLVKKGNHTATSRFKIINDQIILTQEFKEDEFFCTSAVTVSVSGRETRTRLANNSDLQLIIKPGNEPFTVYISSTASFNRNEDIVSSALKENNAAKF
jgi:hypothetical protein